MKRTCIALICLLLMIGTALCLSEGQGGDERMLIAQSGRLTLYLSRDLCSIEVEDAYTGRAWSSAMNDETASGLRINALWQKRISSLISVNYTNLTSGLGVVNNMALLADKQLSASYELIENGVRLIYDMGASEMEIAVEIILDGDTLVARVPWNGIREYGKFSVTSINMLPFLCAATDSAEGYFLYPDGCGAVMEFQDNAHMGESAIVYQVYGNYEKQEALLDMFDEETPRVFMPVFGMSRAGGGLLTVIEDGAESCQISLNSSSKIIGVNYICANFVYRRSFHDMRVTTRDVSVFDAEPIPEDHQVRIIFMEKADPTYSDMACAWRDYLIETGAARRKTESGNKVLVDVFLTSSEDGLLFDSPKTVTTLRQAKEMITALDAAGISDMRISLKGWSSGGYGAVPNRFPISSAVGSGKDLESLIETAHAIGAEVLLTVNVTEASDKERTYSKRNDVVYTGNRVILTNRGESMMMLSADVAAEKLSDIVRKCRKYALDGLRVERIGLSVGFNYWSKHYMTSSETLDAYRAMLDEIRDTFGHAEAEGGNVALLGHAGLFTNVLNEDHGYQVASYKVPLYQIALHGLVDYAAAPGNLSSDLDRDVLMWVELGCLPYFELSYENTEKLIYTPYNGLFSASYLAWADRVKNAALQFTQGPLSELSDVFIVGHTRISDTLVKVTYENGCAVYVNYADTDAEADGICVPATGWAFAGESR